MNGENPIPPRPVTERQRQILDYIREATAAHGCPPTVREIAAHFHIASPKGVQDHLTALERKGLLTRKPGKARNIRLCAPLSTGIPIVGAVAAGPPILAVENFIGTLDFDEAFGLGRLFAVAVKGDSMTGFGILDGDFAIVRQQPTVDTGTIAVVYIDGEATVKKIVRTSHGFQLIPGNERYSPIDVDHTTEGFAVAGPVVGVVRTKVN